MNPSRNIALGLGMIVAGVLALVVGAVVASHDLFVGLILLLIVPLSISFCGAIVTLIGRVRRHDARRRASIVRTIVGVAALAGLGFGFGYSALGALSQLPDYAAGLNGEYLPPSTLSVLLLPGVGLLVGLVLGILVALTWWAAEGRHLNPTTTTPSPR
jgi:hypothetical protein